MTTNGKIILGMGLLSLIFFSGKAFIKVLKTFIPQVEGFSPRAIWDYKQWSWGYGTAAGFDPNKKPAGTITKERAWIEAQKEIEKHYNQLVKLVKKSLNANQWAALLSFSYNAGPANAKNIIQTINTGTPSEVVARMKKYIYAGGQVNQGLINRRAKEANLYLGSALMGTAVFTEPDLISTRFSGPVTDYPY